jgi:hypothetical protein
MAPEDGGTPPATSAMDGKPLLRITFPLNVKLDI